MPSLNILIDSRWLTISITSTIPEDIVKPEAEVKGRQNIVKPEAKIKGRKNITKPARRGRGRPKKVLASIDHRELDDQELRDYMAGKDSLRPDPIF